MYEFLRRILSKFILNINMKSRTALHIINNSYNRIKYKQYVKLYTLLKKHPQVCYNYCREIIIFSIAPYGLELREDLLDYTA